MYETKVVLALVIGYLLGSIPVGVLIGRRQGVDLFEVGSGNIGATNVLRTLGPRWASLVFVLDVLKGLAAVLIAWAFGVSPLWRAAAGLAAIGGHNWSCFLQFRGGKGISTALGVTLGLSWVAAVVALAIWGIVVWASRYVSLGSIVALFCLPTLMGLFTSRTMAWANLWYMLFGVVVLLVGLWRHSANIQKLLSGTENKVGALVAARKETRGRVVRARVAAAEAPEA